LKLALKAWDKKGGGKMLPAMDESIDVMLQPTIKPKIRIVHKKAATGY
jgi:hypothetical protein